MKKEDEDKKNKCRQKKINAINKLQTWKNDFEIEKKIEKEKKKKKIINGIIIPKITLLNVFMEMMLPNAVYVIKLYQKKK